MAPTIQQIQDNITAGGDVRQIINQVADYLQANPSGFILVSPDNSQWQITINDEGALITTKII